MLFSTLPFSIFSPLPFALNYSLTARSGRNRTFASTLFLCRKCLKFPSTLQSMRFDSSGGSKLSCLPFCWKCSLWLLDFGVHGIPCYRSAYEGWLLRGSKLWYLPFSWNNPCGVSATLPSTPAARNYFSFYPPYENWVGPWRVISWLGSFRARFQSFGHLLGSGSFQRKSFYNSFSVKLGDFKARLESFGLQAASNLDFKVVACCLEMIVFTRNSFSKSFISMLSGFTDRFKVLVSCLNYFFHEEIPGQILHFESCQLQGQLSKLWPAAWI